MVTGTVLLKVGIRMTGPSKDALRQLAVKVADGLELEDGGDLGVLGNWSAKSGSVDVGNFKWDDKPAPSTSKSSA